MSSLTSTKRLYHRHLHSFLALPPLRPLLSQATAHTIVLEELGDPMYRSWIFRKRKNASDRKKIERLKYYHRTMHMRSSLSSWNDFVQVRKHTRELLMKAWQRIAHARKSYGFDQLKLHAIQCWAASEIQRWVRGMIGRRLASEQWQLVQAAIKVQGAFRMRSHFLKYMKVVRKRHLLAIRIQVSRRLCHSWIHLTSFVS